MATERDELLETIRSRTLELMQERRLSSDDVGRPAGCPSSTVRLFLNRDRLTVGTAIALARAWPQIGASIPLERLAMLDFDRRRMFWRKVADRKRRSRR